MAIRIREEPLTLSRRLEPLTVEATASGSLRLSAELPDVGQVIRWSAAATVEQVQASAEAGRVEAQGRVRLWVTYTAAGSEADHPAGSVFGGPLEEALSFHAWTDLPAAEGETTWEAQVAVRDVDARFRPDGRTADLDVVLVLQFTGTARLASPVVTQVSATLPDRVEVSQVPLKAAVLQYQGRSRVTLSDVRQLELPEGAQRLRVIDAAVYPQVTRAEHRGGAAEVTGQVTSEVLYLYWQPLAAAAAVTEEEGPGAGGDTGAVEGSPPHDGEEASEGGEGAAPPPAPRGEWRIELARWTWESPFTTRLATSGVETGNLVRAVAQAAGWVARARLADHGFVEVNADVDVAASVYAQRSVSLVGEARAADGGARVEQRKVTVPVEEYLGEGRRTLSGAITVEMVPGQAPVDRVVWCGARVESIVARADTGRINVSTTMTPWAYYLPYKADAQTGGLVFVSWPSALTVDQALSVPEARPDAGATAYVGALHVETDLINRQTLEFKVQGNLWAEARRVQEREVVAEAVACLPAAEGPAPYYYLVITQKGDTLWKLARRYGVGPEAVVAANPDLAGIDETQALPEGTRVFLTRTAAGGGAAGGVERPDRAVIS